MKLRDKLFSIGSVFNAYVFRKRTPLLVSWEITTRCNKSCAYCDIRNMKAGEMNTRQVLSMITELSQLGTKIIHFTGGEPLLRDDIGAIIDYSSEKGILTSINSNGSLLPQRISELKNLKLIGLSLDGPEEVHDRIRGEGSYRQVREALSLSKSRGINIRIHTVLTRLNLQCIDFLLEIAEEYGAHILFQPATALLLGGNQPNPLSPDEKGYRQAIEYLIEKKKKRECIGHSLSGFTFLSDWPRLKTIRCLAPLLSARIESDGSVDICFRDQGKSKPIDARSGGFRKGFYSLPFAQCNQCCCPTSVELNCALSFDLNAIFNMWRLSGSLL